MPDDFYFYQPEYGHGLPHDPFKSIVGPRPIAWIGTTNADGSKNLAPYSFFNSFRDRPPILGFSINGKKDTMINCDRTREFTWNLVTADLIEQMNTSSATVGYGVDEFDLASLDWIKGRLVDAPRVAKSLVSFECKMIDLFEMRNLQQEPIDCYFVFGQVVGVHIANRALRDGIYDTARNNHLVRGGGTGDYFRITPDNLIVKERPKS